MSRLHSQLALFGAIDQEVVEAKARLREGAENDPQADTDIIDMVEAFLPGTTGFGQHGWYQELVNYLTTNATTEGSEQIAFPDLDQAINDLVEGSPEEDDERDPVLARAVYGAVVLEKIYRRRIRTADPLRVLQRSLDGWSHESGDDAETELRNRIDDISNRREWVTELRGVAGEDFTNASRPCFGSLRKVDGLYCAYITTDTTDSTITVKDVAKIVEPINWNSCCKFFCKMMKQTTGEFNGEGWNRIVERISGECAEYYLDTALVFWKGQLDDGSIFINYDLDPNRTGDSGLVEVDSGYIWISPGKPTGVRIRTSKLERVSGLSPTATAALACLMGWGDTGHEMLAGTARKYMKNPTMPPGMKPFPRSPYDKSPYKG